LSAVRRATSALSAAISFAWAGDGPEEVFEAEAVDLEDEFPLDLVVLAFAMISPGRYSGSADEW
jgi:hypothetical protein